MRRARLALVAALVVALVGSTPADAASRWRLPAPSPTVSSDKRVEKAAGRTATAEFVAAGRTVAPIPYPDHELHLGYSMWRVGVVATRAKTTEGARALAAKRLRAQGYVPLRAATRARLEERSGLLWQINPNGGRIWESDRHLVVVMSGLVNPFSASRRFGLEYRVMRRSEVLAAQPWCRSAGVRVALDECLAQGVNLGWAL